MNKTITDNPQPDEHNVLTYGCKYMIWFKGEYIGEGVWTKDENAGDSFQIREGNKIKVCTPDKWEIILES